VNICKGRDTSEGRNVKEVKEVKIVIEGRK
jgi:hypothetical protein